MIRPAPRARFSVDQTLFGATLALVVIGLWMVFDSSYVRSLDSTKMSHDAFFLLRRQAGGAVVGCVALFAMMRYGYWNLRRHAVGLMVFGLALLLAVYLPKIGISENHARRWLKIGIQFQPSEIAKMTLIVYIAALLSRPHVQVRDFKMGLGPPLFVSALYLIAIDREPDLGTALVLFLAVMTVLFLAGAQKRHLALIISVSLVLIAVATLGFGHRRGRIQTYLHPEQNRQGAGFQVIHSIQGIGTGGLTGVGPGQGKQKYFLPQAYNDFIFTTYAEETGLVGGLVLIGLLCLVGWRGFCIAMRTKDRFGSLLAAGIAALISWQAIVNLGAATATLPSTGVPLPFISNGSTSLVFLLGGIGILLNIAQHPLPPAAPEESRGVSRR